MRRCCVVVAIGLLALVTTFAGRDVRAAGGVTYREGSRKVAHADAFGRQKVSCPPRTSVVSGGVNHLGEGGSASIVTSAPFDSGDPGGRPDDGWIGVVKNTDINPIYFSVFAVCARGKFVYARQTFDVPSSNTAETGGGVLCPIPSGGTRLKVVGGGASVSTGGSLAVELASLSPLDADPDAVRDDGWYAEANNESGQAQKLTVHAICATSGTYTYDTANGSFLPFATSAWRSSCGSGKIAISGGLIALGEHPDVEFFWHYPDDLGAGHDTWVTALYNGTASDVGVIVSHICKVL